MTNYETTRFPKVPAEKRSHLKDVYLCLVRSEKIFYNCNDNASFCLFICAFVFASISGHFRINDFLLIFTPLLLLNYFLFNIFFILAKKWGSKAPPAPLCAVPEEEVLRITGEYIRAKFTQPIQKEDAFFSITGHEVTDKYANQEILSVCLPPSHHFFFASSRHPAQRNVSIPIPPACTCQHTIDVTLLAD